MAPSRRIPVDPHALAALCRKHAVQRLSLFGSILRDDFRADSDIDILVEFAPGQTPSLLELGGLQQELSALFGRTVDLKTPGFLSRYFRDRVIREALVQYAA